MKVSNPKYTPEQVGLTNNHDDLPNFGQVSTSMGVDTKPAHCFEIDGYWVLVDPNMPDEELNKLFPCTLIFKKPCNIAK
jgi:hypothetical protein